MSKIWDQSYAHVRKWEGGFSDVSGDSGGKTMYGIASNYFPSDYKIVKGMVDAGNKIGAQEYVKGFYYREFWVKSGSHLIKDPALALTNFDMAVNSGISRANKILEASNNNANAYNDGRESFYRSIAIGDRAKFLKGWLNRLEDARSFDPDNAPTDSTDYDVDDTSSAGQSTGTGNARPPSSKPFQDSSSGGSGSGMSGGNGNPSTQESDNPTTDDNTVVEDDARNQLEDLLNNQEESVEELEEPVDQEKEDQEDFIDVADSDSDLKVEDSKGDQGAEKNSKEKEIVEALAEKEDLTLLDVLNMLVEKAPLTDAQLKILKTFIAGVESKKSSDTDLSDEQDNSDALDDMVFQQEDDMTPDMIDTAAEQYGHHKQEVSLEKFVMHKVGKLLPDLDNKISDYIETTYPELGRENSTHLFSKIVEKNYSHIYKQIETDYDMTHGEEGRDVFKMQIHNMKDIIGKDDDSLDHLVEHNSGHEPHILHDGGDGQAHEAAQMEVFDVLNVETPVDQSEII